MVLRRAVHPHMRGPKSLKPPGHNLDRQVRTVAIPAQMPQTDVAQTVRNCLLDHTRGSLIREMAVPAQNPLFDTPGAARVLLQQLQIVVCLEDQHVGRTHPLDDQPGGVSQIGEETDVSAI